MPPQLDTISGRYVLEEEITKGGMATVWRARDDVLARPVAVKVLHPHLSEDDAFLSRFRREALAAARLSHPNIVSIFDTGTHPLSNDGTDLQYIVMELCSGGTLADVLAKNRALPPEQVASIGRTVCEALGYAHREGIVHRDVKPANVLIAGDGLLKVADFGIAKAAFSKGDITTTGTILGTVTYLSPEQSRGEEPDQRSDIYGLGITLYELVVGRPPFAAETQIATAMMHVKDPPPPLRSIKAGIPRSLEAPIMRSLEKDPNDRFQTTEEFAAALDTVRGGSGPALPVRSTAPAPRVRRDRKARSSGDAGWLVRVVAAIALTIGLALFVASLVDEDGDGRGPERRAVGDAEQGGGPVEVSSATDFDPHGGDGEHPKEAPNAADGDASTAWTTQTYNAPLEALGKPGVGLLFDLGDAVEVGRVSIAASPGMVLELRVSDGVGNDEGAFEEVASRSGTPETFELTFDGTTGRYWLLWITTLSESGGGAASIYEVEFSAG